MTTAELLRRAITIKLSRPEVWAALVKDGSELYAANENWYILADIKPNYPMPAINGRVFITEYAIYVADPVGYGCNACWSKQAGNQTI